MRYRLKQILQLFAAFATLIAVCLIDDARAAEAPPNILLIVADDLGWNDVGWHGSQFRTPHLDELVRTGVELDRHYVQPVCTPTRTALLSGRWTGRFGPHALAPSNRRIFPRGATTLASALREQGYATHIAGKWHLGSRPEWGPNHYGFDHSYGSLNGAVDPWTHLYRPGPYLRTWHRDGTIFDEQGNATELVAQEVRSWISNSKAPWFVYVPFHAVHIPIDCPEEYKTPFAEAQFDADPEKNESLRRMAAFVLQMDKKVGEFIKLLEETGQRERTLIVFTSDNGGLASGGNAYVGDVPPTPALSSNTPLRGFKNQLYEGGIRVPAFVNWPAKLSARKVDATLHAADWTPTLTRLAGWSPTTKPEFDGVDIWPVLTGAQSDLPARSVYIPHRSGAVVLREGWKLIVRGNNDQAELFHVSEDPSETHELSKAERERVNALRRELKQLRAGDLTELPQDLAGVAD